MTAIANLPDLRPSLLLDFANSGRVDPRIQCTRASAATCFGPDGKLRTVAANVPRIDYDPATGKCLGLLVEEQRTNLVSRSNELSHADWVKSGLVDIGAPDANLMTKLVATTENRTHSLYSATTSIGFADDTLLTISVEAKAGGMNFFWLRCVNKAGGFASATFNLLTGAASLRGATSANMKSLGGGVYRCSATFNLGAGASGAAGRTLLALATGEGAGAEVFAGDGVAGVWFRNVQTEGGAFPTSYIPAEASASTKAGDLPSVTLTQESGCILIRYLPRVSPSAGQNYFLSALNSGATRMFGAFYNASGVVRAAEINVGSLRQGVNSLAMSYGGGSVTSVSNGGSSFTSTYVVAPPSALHVGTSNTSPSGPSAFGPINGHIQSILVYPSQLPALQMQRLTA
ncbi:phage head spike fiber domain-containing protein [Comamonas aquatica]|uniref:phage head spike fiber domain-containing protein n=1 Tax=Comamonas aquatica TaxID=225991 RepID=UPI0034D409B5